MRFLKRYSIKDVSGDYAEAFQSVFGKWTFQGNCPSEVYFGYEDDQIVGFLSGYPLSLNTWYIQRAGFVKNERNKFSNLTRILFALDEIHKDWMSLIVLVESNDIKSLRIALEMGFKIVGTNIDSAKTLWINMMRIKEIYKMGHC